MSSNPAYGVQKLPQKAVQSVSVSPGMQPPSAGTVIMATTPKRGSDGLCNNSTLARLEPPRGMLLGTYVDEQGLSKNGEITLQGMTQHDFAVFFRYWKLGPKNAVFPEALAKATARARGAMHIALEPSVPLKELDNATLERFAKATGQAGVPVFVRFASEMNDPKNEWSKDPVLYVDTWKRLARYLRIHAPGAALVWMPMASRWQNAQPYYPGAAYVDWAGLSLYSMPYRNGSASQNSTDEDPVVMIKSFYEHYSCAHPIQISEYGASSRTGVDPSLDYSAFAVEKMREAYYGAWMFYPRLKNINWLHIDMHTSRFITQKDPRRFNDYSLFTNPAKREAFAQLYKTSHFLSSWKASQCINCNTESVIPWPASISQRSGLVSGVVWPDPIMHAWQVRAFIDNQEIPVQSNLPYRFSIDPSRLSPGNHQISVNLIGPAGRIIGMDVQNFQIIP